MIVEVDESKMGKRKYHRGHRVDGVWIFGGIERTEERRFFVVPVENRSASTLLELIHRHVHRGSIVYSDLWRGYFGLRDDPDYLHMTVNHSLHFVDPLTGVHTNGIEGVWNGIKLRVPPRNRIRAGMEDKLWEQVWRKKNNSDLWNGFISALVEISVHFNFTGPTPEIGYLRFRAPLQLDSLNLTQTYTVPPSRNPNP